jgi:hypothetical protein
LYSLVSAFLFQKQDLVANKISLSALPPWEGWIALVAQHNTFLYGLATALLAILAGFGASFLFGRKTSNP